MGFSKLSATSFMFSMDRKVKIFYKLFLAARYEAVQLRKEYFEYFHIEATNTTKVDCGTFLGN